MEDGEVGPGLTLRKVETGRGREVSSESSILPYSGWFVVIWKAVTWRLA